METPWGHFGQLEVSHHWARWVWGNIHQLAWAMVFGIEEQYWYTRKALQRTRYQERYAGHSRKFSRLTHNQVNQVNQATRLHHSTWLQPLNQVTRGQLGVQLGGQKVVDVISLWWFYKCHKWIYFPWYEIKCLLLRTTCFSWMKDDQKYLLNKLV